jgi:hypothetical protein
MEDIVGIMYLADPDIKMIPQEDPHSQEFLDGIQTIGSN